MNPLPLGHLDMQYNNGQLFTIRPDDRRRHIAVFGSSGAGKTTLLHNMISWDIHDDLGVEIVDPHGDLIDALADAIPRSRTNDVIYFDPLDPTHALGLNIFERVAREQQPLVVSSFISIFKAIWGDSWGPRMENILRNSAYVLIEQPQPVSLAALPRLLTDDDYRARALAHVTNPEVLRFFTQEYNVWKPTDRHEAISPVLNKTAAFLANPYLRSILGQASSSFDFRAAMDTGKILLCKFSKGRIGEMEAQLLCSLVATKTSLAALTRQNIPEDKRRLFMFYADEAQNLHGAHLPTMLAEARKYGLALTLSAQSPSQLPEETCNAVFSNCATIITFRVGGNDAETFKREMADVVLPAEHYQNLPNWKMYVRTMMTRDGQPPIPSGPYAVDTFPQFPRSKTDTFRERVIAASRTRYGRRRDDVDRKINRFLTPKSKRPTLR